jgi:hypothetical protein
MKTINKTITCLLLLSLFACSRNLDKWNEDPNGVNQEKANPNLVLSTVLTETGKAFVNLGYQNVAGVMQHTQKDGWSTEHNIYEWGGSQSWSDYYNILRNNEYVYERSVALKYELQQGMTLVMKSMVFGLITDLWGDAPYTAALKGAAGGASNVFPAFDDQETIYKGILADLETANTLLSKSKSEYTSTADVADVYYKGDPAKWRKLANSLALRYYMRISDKLPDIAKAGIEKIAGNAAEYPVINSADEDAAMPFAGNSNDDSWPANTTYDADGSNYRRLKMCATLVKAMRTLHDPRLGVWANKIQIPLVVDPALPAGTDKIEGGKRYLSPDKVAGIEVNQDPEYVGIPPGLNNGAPIFNMGPDPSQAARNPHVSWLNDIYKEAKGPLLKARLLSAAEVHFILAEAAMKGWAAGDAKTHYEAAVKASLTAWGLAAKYDTYIADPGVVFNNTLAQLMEQKWISSWTAATESWFDFRRTGLPKLKAGPDALRKVLPVRFYYMLEERNLNKVNTEAAMDKLEVTTYSEADGKNSPWSKPWLVKGTAKPW